MSEIIFLEHNQSFIYQCGIRFFEHLSEHDEQKPRFLESDNVSPHLVLEVLNGPTPPPSIDRILRKALF